MIVSNPMGLTGLAADGTNVYFGELNMTGNASLYYAPIGGSAAATVLYTSADGASQSGEGYVVTAGGAVYWTDVDFSNNPPTTNIMGIAAP